MDIKRRKAWKGSIFGCVAQLYKAGEAKNVNHAYAVMKILLAGVLN